MYLLKSVCHFDKNPTNHKTPPRTFADLKEEMCGTSSSDRLQVFSLWKGGRTPRGVSARGFLSPRLVLAALQWFSSIAEADWALTPLSKVLPLE